MAPTAHDPFRPARPKRSGLDLQRPAAPPPAVECLVCRELADAGMPVPDVDHAPEQHIGGTDGDVVLSVTPPPLGIEYADDLDPLRFTAEWWDEVTPDGVEVLYVAERRIPLPRLVRERFWEALGALDLDEGEDVDLAARLVDAWQDAEDREALEVIAEGLAPDDWVAFAASFRQAVDDEGEVAGILAAVVDSFTPIDPAGPFAEHVEQGPVPEGHVRVAVLVADVDRGPNGEEMGYGFTADVPVDAKAAIAYIGAPDGDGGEPTAEKVADDARAVLAAELTRAPSSRRKSVLDAVADHLSPAEVEERTRQVDNPDEIVPGPEDGREGDGTLGLDGG